jgi:fused signal recognition particle receptor
MEGLAKTRIALGEKLSQLFQSSSEKNDPFFEELRQILYSADLGAQTSEKLINHLKTKGPLDLGGAKAALREEALAILEPRKKELVIHQKPFVILVVGVNGVGKTTSIGKLGAYFKAQGKKVLFVAGDTFRAGAIDQLKTWGDRLEIPVIAHKPGSDPSAVCYDGVKAALAQDADVLLIDTAGRLQNKSDLMAELGKIKRVIGRDLPEAPHEVWLVLDGTTGQNAFSQARAFKEVAQVTGLIVTKLDGTAKGGVLLGVSSEEGLPVYFIGVGEKAESLRPFEPQAFVESLF